MSHKTVLLQKNLKKKRNLFLSGTILITDSNCKLLYNCTFAVGDRQKKRIIFIMTDK